MLFKIFMVILIVLVTSAVVMVTYEIRNAYEDKNYTMDPDVFDFYKPPEQVVYQYVEKSVDNG